MNQVKVTRRETVKTVQAKTTSKDTIIKGNNRAYKWWNASDSQIAHELLSTALFLKETQSYRHRQASVFARLYGNLSLYNFAGTSNAQMDRQLPTDRPTYNVIAAIIDTLTSKLTQSRPQPVFLTDNGNYKERAIAKRLSNFILGEFYREKIYEKAEYVLRDSMWCGTGAWKVYRGIDDKVKCERKLVTDLQVDPSEARMGDPRQLYEYALVDRQVLLETFPEFKERIQSAEQAYPDNGVDASKSISDLVMVVEGWHLKSGPDAKDGRHTIACSAGIIHDDKEWDKDDFPFVFDHYSKRILGFWGQGVAERQMGTQLDLNSLLFTISKSIKLTGVPRVFVEENSKVVSAHLNNDIGAIIKFTGVKPSYEVAPCSPAELYAERDKLIQYAFQSEGVSQLQATSQKPAGLNSGEAIRTYDDIANDRSAAQAKRYSNMFINLAYKIIDTAIDIAEDTGSYKTIFPDKQGTAEIALPKLSKLKDPFVIQCFDISSLPRDPAGRMQKVAEMIQAGMISIKEGRRLLDYPDLEQIEVLANASEERIYTYLDQIVEDGKYNGPDPFMDLNLASEIVVQYYNLYQPRKLEEDRCQMLRDFYDQVQALKTAAQPPAMAAAPAPNMPQANPEALPTSPLVPNVNQPMPQGA